MVKILKTCLLVLFILAFAYPSFSQIQYGEDGISFVEDESEGAEYKEPRRRRRRVRRQRSRLKNESRRKTRRTRRRKPPVAEEGQWSEDFSNDASDEFGGTSKKEASQSSKYDWEKSPKGNEFFLNFRADPLTGEARVEGRAFEKVDQEEETIDKNLALFLRLTLPLASNSDQWGGKIKAHGRVDAFDEGRNKVYPEDIWLSYTKGFLQARLGFQVFNWTQMDIFQPAELINSVNFDSEVENLEKIGELALTIKTQLSFGFLELIYMPFFLAPNFPSANSRFNVLEPGNEMGSPIVVKKDGSLVERNQFHQFAAFFSKSLESMDFNLFFIDQVDRRSPEIVFQNSSNEFRPVYFPITTFGMNLIRPQSGWILKFEAARRLVTNPVQPTIFGELKKKSHSFAAVGIEREFLLGEKTLTAFLEHQRLFGVSEETSDVDKQKLSVFQNDVALGLRLGFNDLQGREIRVLVDIDLDRSDQLLGSISYKQRIGESWQLKGGYRYIYAPQESEIAAVGLEQFHQDNYGFLELTRFF